MRNRVILMLSVALLSVGASHASERDALVALYEAMGGLQWDQADGWLTEAPLNEWHGVETVQGRVVKIVLANNGLWGQLPDAVGDFPDLEILDLRWNGISGALPDSLSRLKRLEELLLTGNALTGAIPRSLGSMPTLKRLDLSYNRLSGTVPGVLMVMPNLKSLGLAHNEISSPLPHVRGKSLEKLIVNGAGADPQHIDGSAVLEASTLIVDDERDFEIMMRIMSAIVVQDGYLILMPWAMPEGIDRGQVEMVIREVNDGLLSAGETVETVGDLERSLEVYGKTQIDLPVDGGKDAPRKLVRKNLGSSDPVARAVCQLKPHNAHKSTPQPHLIKGKASKGCQYVSGPYQSLTWKATVRLLQFRDVGRFGAWRTIGKKASKTKYITNPYWHQSELTATAPCVNGIYRTRLRLFLTGSVSGEFDPHPLVRYSAATAISGCE